MEWCHEHSLEAIHPVIYCRDTISQEENTLPCNTNDLLSLQIYISPFTWSAQIFCNDKVQYEKLLYGFQMSLCGGGIFHVSVWQSKSPLPLFTWQIYVRANQNQSYNFIKEESTAGLWSTDWCFTWWCHDKKILSTLLILSEGNPSATCGFSSQRANDAELRWFLLVARSCWTNSWGPVACNDMTTAWWPCKEVNLLHIYWCLSARLQ